MVTSITPWSQSGSVVGGQHPYGTPDWLAAACSLMGKLSIIVKLRSGGTASMREHLDSIKTYLVRVECGGLWKRHTDQIVKDLGVQLQADPGEVARQQNL
eukprot:Em0001g1041a